MSQCSFAWRAAVRKCDRWLLVKRAKSVRRSSFAVVPDLVDALEEAIRAHCLESMGEHSKRDLNQLDTRSLVADYATWRARFPSARPRAVHESDVMAANEHRGRYA